MDNEAAIEKALDEIWREWEDFTPFAGWVKRILLNLHEAAEDNYPEDWKDELWSDSFQTLRNLGLFTPELKQEIYCRWKLRSK